MFLSFLKQAYLSKKNLKLSKEQIKLLQQEKFIKLVRFAAQKSPYYQKIAKNNIDINNCKPEDFPILTKETLIKEFDNIVTDKQITKAIMKKRIY